MLSRGKLPFSLHVQEETGNRCFAAWCQSRKQSHRVLLPHSFTKAVWGAALGFAEGWQTSNHPTHGGFKAPQGAQWGFWEPRCTSRAAAPPQHRCSEVRIHSCFQWGKIGGKRKVRRGGGGRGERLCFTIHFPDRNKPIPPTLPGWDPPCEQNCQQVLQRRYLARFKAHMKLLCKIKHNYKPTGERRQANPKQSDAFETSEAQSWRNSSLTLEEQGGIGLDFHLWGCRERGEKGGRGSAVQHGVRIGGC